MLLSPLLDQLTKEEEGWQWSRDQHQRRPRSVRRPSSNAAQSERGTLGTPLPEERHAVHHAALRHGRHKPWKWGWAKRRWAFRVKHTADFNTKRQKNNGKCLLNTFMLIICWNDSILGILG